MSNSSISELAARIAINTIIVNNFYTQNGLPTPSFDQASPLKPVISLSTAPEIEAARQAVIYDCQELRILMQGPAQYLASISVRLASARRTMVEILERTVNSTDK